MNERLSYPFHGLKSLDVWVRWVVPFLRFHRCQSAWWFHHSCVEVLRYSNERKSFWNDRQMLKFYSSEPSNMRSSKWWTTRWFQRRQRSFRRTLAVRFTRLTDKWFTRLQWIKLILFLLQFINLCSIKQSKNLSIQFFFFSNEYPRNNGPPQGEHASQDLIGS